MDDSPKDTTDNMVSKLRKKEESIQNKKIMKRIQKQK